jgi:hypothetical protein
MGSATYGHAVYRELDAAGQAWLDGGDPAPLLRIMAEQTWWGDGGPIKEYSEALYVAVACNDYPQLWDIFAPFEVREQQLEAAIEEVRAADPDGFHPWTVDEWVTADWIDGTICLKWPSPDHWVPPLPEPHTYPDVPVLVMVGDLDSITPPEASMQVASYFPNSTYVEVANVAHVVALGDYHGCTSTIAVAFVETGGDPGDASCAATTYQEVRTVESFPVTLAEITPATGASEHAGRVARAVTDTVGDIFSRWMNAVGSDGVGLRGGTFSSTGLDVVSFTLTELRYVTDLRVSGRVDWNRFTGEIMADVRFTGGATGRLTITWNDYDHHAVATAKGKVGNEAVNLTLPAP